jgi:N-acylmannosamine kinase
MTTLAIDIGGTKLAAALVDGDLQIHQRRELPTPASKTPMPCGRHLALVAPLASQARQVAVASTGIIREGTLQAINPQNLGGLLHFPLVSGLTEITGLPALAVNDAQAAAWAEYHALGESIDDMVFITVSLA